MESGVVQVDIFYRFGAALLIGLLVGGLVGYAISHTSQVDNYHYDRYPVTYYAE